MIKKIINTKYNKEREEKIEMKNLMNKLSKILLVLFMFLTSTIQVHAEPTEGGGSGEETITNVTGFTFEYANDVYTITETTGKLNIPEEGRDLELQFYDEENNRVASYTLSDIKNNEDGTYTIEKSYFYPSSFEANGQYSVYLAVYDYNNGMTVYHLTSDNESGMASVESPFKSLPEGTNVQVVEDGLLITATDPTSDEAQVWLNTIVDNMYNEWPTPSTAIYIVQNGNWVQFTDPISVTEKGILLSYDSLINYGIPQTNVRVIVETPSYVTFEDDDNELQQGAIPSDTIEFNVYQDEETHNVIISANKEDTDAMNFLSSIYNFELYGDNGWDNRGIDGSNSSFNDADGTLTINANMFTVSTGTYRLTLSAYGYTNKVINNFEVIYTSEEQWPEGGDGPQGPADGGQGYIFDELSLSYDKDNKVYTLTDIGEIPFEFTPENASYYIKFYEGRFENEFGEVIFDWCGGEYEVVLHPNDGMYTFTSEDIIKNSNQLSSNNYYMILTVYSESGIKTYELNTDPIYFDDIEMSPYEENKYFVRDLLELSYDKDTQTYIIKRKDGQPINILLGNEDQYIYTFNFYSSSGEVYWVDVELNPNDDFTVLAFKEENIITYEGSYLKEGDYYVVLNANIDDQFGEFALNNTPIYFPFIPSKINIDKIDDVGASIIKNGDGTYTIQLNGTLPTDDGLAILFAKDDKNPDDTIYYNYGEYMITGWKQDVNGYTFSRENYNSQGNDSVTPAGNYIPYLTYWDSESNHYFIPLLPEGEEMEFESSHKPLPKDLMVKNDENGILLTAKNPYSEEFQEWINTLIQFGAYDCRINIGNNMLPEQIDYYQVMKDGDNVIGLYISYELTIDQGIPSGTHYAEFTVRGYPSYRTNVTLEKGAINSDLIDLHIYQETGTYDMIFESSNLEYLKSLNWVWTNCNCAADIDTKGNEWNEPNAYIETVDENLYRLRLEYSAFSNWPQEDESQDIVYKFFGLRANGYTEKRYEVDFELKTNLKTHGDAKFIVTSKGLVLRSTDEDYLKAVNSALNQGEVMISFYSGNSFVDINNQTNPIFSGVYKYSDRDEYYTYISAEKLKNCNLEDGFYSISLVTQNVGYTNYSPWLVEFDLTAIIKIYDQVTASKENNTLLNKDELENLDEDITNLSNVTVNSTTTNNYDNNINIDGIVTGAVITDNNGNIDKDTLAFEDKENVDVNVNIEGSEQKSTTEEIGAYQIVSVDDSFNISVIRNVNYNGDENIIELPLEVMVEIGEYEITEGNELKILKTHTDANGNTTEELLDVYYNATTGKYYFYTSQFSNFQVVQAKSSCTHENKTSYEGIAATCEQPGKLAYTKCNDCGTCFDLEGNVILESDTAISATGHSFTNYVSDNNATCTNDGTKTAQCDNHCGKTDTVADTGSMKEHDLDEWTTAEAPTCTETGREIIKCKNCDYHVFRAVEALGHTEEIIPAVDPTCTETGLTEGKHCSVCGETIVAQTVVDALGHTFIDGECSCGEKEKVLVLLTETVKLQLGSFFSTDVLDYIDIENSDPELVENAVVTVEYSKMETSEGGYQYPAVGIHTITITTTNKTYTVQGIIVDESGPMWKDGIACIETNLGEKPDYEYYLRFFAAADTSGVTLSYDDSRVNYDELGTYDLDIIATDGYGNKSTMTIDLIVVEDINPQIYLVEDGGNYCEEAIIKVDLGVRLEINGEDVELDENNQYTINTVGTFTVRAYKPLSLGETTITITVHEKHNFELDENSVVKATCTTKGFTGNQYCSHCGEFLQGTPVDALGHTEIIDKAVEPTCEETGLTEGKHCSVCQEVLVAQKEVAAKGHTHVLDTTTVKEATCTTDGYTGDKKCSCGDVVKGEVVKATGHKYVNGECTCGAKEEVTKPEEPTKEPEINAEVEKLPVVDTTKPVEEVTVGTTETTKEIINETVKEIIENIKENNKVTNVSKELVESIIEEIEKGNDVDLVTEVVIKPIDEKEVTKETIQLIVETVNGSEVAQYLDLSVLVSVLVNDEVIATSEITELSKPMTFTIVIPEELAKVEDGFTRTYYVVREHNGVVEKLPVTVNGDGTLTFSTDKFSTYALIYVDTKVEDVETETPETTDNYYVMLYAIMALLSFAILVVLKQKKELSK